MCTVILTNHVNVLVRVDETVLACADETGVTLNPEEVHSRAVSNHGKVHVTKVHFLKYNETK